jgi:hypothetical protein
MPRIVIEDLPLLEELTEQEMASIFGGHSHAGSSGLGGDSSGAPSSGGTGSVHDGFGG